MARDALRRTVGDAVGYRQARANRALKVPMPLEGEITVELHLARRLKAVDFMTQVGVD